MARRRRGVYMHRSLLQTQSSLPIICGVWSTCSRGSSEFSLLLTNLSIRSVGSSEKTRADLLVPNWPEAGRERSRNDQKQFLLSFSVQNLLKQTAKLAYKV